MATPPDGRQQRRPPDRHDPSRPPGVSPDGADETRLAPAEQARIDDAVVRVGARRGAGPVIVTVLVAAAFLVGLIRPWDWLAGDPTAAGRRAGNGAGRTQGPGEPGDAGPVGSAGPPDGGASFDPVVPVQEPTCGYPTSWRTATISFWAGARARIWTAAEAVTATGPEDPSIPFNLIASDVVEALGWCAPVSGPERPPLAAVGTLYRVRDGVASVVRVDRLEPAAADALGELWLPPAQTVGRRPAWVPGRYVLRLATPSGTYVRYLGLEVGVPGSVPRSSPSAPASAPASASPPASPAAGVGSPAQSP